MSAWIWAEKWHSSFSINEVLNAFEPFQYYKEKTYTIYKNEGFGEERIKYGIIAMWAKVHGIASIASMQGINKDFEWEDVLDKIRNEIRQKREENIIRMNELSNRSDKLNEMVNNLKNREVLLVQNTRYEDLVDNLLPIIEINRHCLSMTTKEKNQLLQSQPMSHP